MDRCMTPGAPACAPGQIRGMVVIRPHLGEICLDMAAQAQVGITSDQHLVRDRTMHLMASGTSVAQGLVFTRKRPALIFMAFKTNFVRVVHARCRPWPRVNAMEIMTIGAAHMALQNRMAVGNPDLLFFCPTGGKKNPRVFWGVK